MRNEYDICMTMVMGVVMCLYFQLSYVPQMICQHTTKVCIRNGQTKSRLMQFEPLPYLSLISLSR